MIYLNFHTHLSQPSPEVCSIVNILNPDQIGNALSGSGYFSVGIHPWHIHPDHWEEDVSTVEQYIHNKKVLAIGEAGLDRLTDLPLDIQLEVFKSMVRLSEISRKPLIIHSVRTHAEVLLLHRQLKPEQPWIIHGFNLRLSVAKAFLDQGFYLSFGQAILQHHSAAVNAMINTPLSRLFLETDDSQTDIRIIYERAAQLLNIDVQDLGEIIINTFNKITNNERA